MIVNKQGYVCRSRLNNREWFLIKHKHDRISGLVSLGEIHTPKHLIGRRVRFKMEVIE